MNTLRSYKLSLLLIVGSMSCYMQGFSHTFRNTTPYNVTVKVHYATGACSNDTYQLAPGQSDGKSVAGCSLTKVTATISEVPIAGAPNQPVAPRTVEARSFDGPISKDGTWLIVGPYGLDMQAPGIIKKDAQGNPINTYTVTRVCA